MFYSDYGFRAYAPKISNYILRFANHYDQYVNSILVRSVDYSQVCLQ
ncbi:hypothetical protein [Paraburkholderia elongata]|uniref:Uncharacterized protein n=1 Tax=Paraburkholderia elongata TaxID=2675747 RepID=A0A972NTY7_9BURK|nr:hypothetical protein [Paraburkholderia elongata]NPT59056.1 hypothetical protein [Paraburkholderia elongata]